MSVDQATVRRVAKLARIKVKEENVERLAGELNSILHWIEQLNEVNVEGVEPMTSVVTVKMKKRAVRTANIPMMLWKTLPSTETIFPRAQGLNDAPHCPPHRGGREGLRKRNSLRQLTEAYIAPSKSPHS